MGIRMLETFVKDFVPNGFKEIKIEDEIKRFASKEKQKPILVIDLTSLIRVMITNKKDILFGGRWNVHADFIDDLFARLKQLGADLVFFEDGLIETSKYQTWIKRQNSRYAEHIAIIDCVNSGRSVVDIMAFNMDKVNAFATLLPVIQFMARKHGVLKFSVHKDCDVEMARYANENNALAILSDDTDFLIFPGKWKFWSIKSINSVALTTIELSRQGLRSTLELTDEQLVSLSTIAGNDIIRFEEVEEAIRANFRFTPGARFLNIARYIKNKLPTQFNAKARAIASLMLGNTRESTLKRVKDSLNSYRTDFKEKEFSPLLQQCLSLDLQAISTFKILNRFPKNFTLAFFDLRKPDIPSYHEIASKLFQRQLGVLFHGEKTEDRDMKYEVYSRKSHDGSFEKLTVEPIYPEMEVPPMMELLDPENSEIDDDRYALLKWMISSKLLKNADLRSLPDSYFLDVLTLVLMRDVEALKVVEADIFLHCFKMTRNKRRDVEYPEVIHERAFRLAFLFGKVREAIHLSLEIVGLLKHYTISQFDGVLFHSLYLDYKNEGRTIQDFGEVEAYRLYK